MRDLTVLTATAILGLGLAASGSKSANAQEHLVLIGTGGVTGVYYPTGGVIQRLVNAGRADHGVRVSVESTVGSVFNVNAIRMGQIDMAIVQSDVQHNALRGEVQFADQGAFEDLRSMFSVHGEPFTVIANADAGVATFEDLVGKRVNVGPPGSGQRATMEVLMEAYGWTLDDFALVSELTSIEQSQALCDNSFDVMVFAVGHPNGSIQEATTSCETVIVPVEGEVINALIQTNPQYLYATIPGGMYAGNPDDVATFGPKATLVTSAALADDAVYTIVSSVFENLDSFRDLHPAFASLTAEAMANDALSAPLHDGARRYFEENGLLAE